MKVPKRLEPLIEEGLVDEVLRSLMSGKEASVYVVLSGGQLRCAKVYKESAERSFRQRADYQEGRRVRNSREQRAIEKGTRYGRRQMESAWRSAEVEHLHRLAAAGVRVPRSYGYLDGVLLMELVTDASGEPAPRLLDCDLTAERAREIHGFLLRQVIKMLSAGLVHGDLSEYNVLLGVDGPVIIDLPQAANVSGNRNARRLLERDVANVGAWLGRFAPELRRADYGKEIWHLYETGKLHPEVELTGRFRTMERPADVGSVLREIDHAREDHERRGGRTVVDVPRKSPAPPPKGGHPKGGPPHGSRRHGGPPRGPRSAAPGPRPHGQGARPPGQSPRPPGNGPPPGPRPQGSTPAPAGPPHRAAGPGQDATDEPRRRKRRRRRRKPGPGTGSAPEG